MQEVLRPRAIEPEQVDLKLEHYLVSSNFLPSRPDRLVISVSSLGFAPRERFQQFWKLIESNNCDALFVANHTVNWFNNEETDSLFNHLGAVARRYNNVAIMGESMGASGAILLSNYISSTPRVLCFAPQFSANTNFMGFDERYEVRVSKIKNQHYSNFSFSRLRDRTLMMFGDQVWQDEVHRAMFERAGFRVLTVAKSDHAVALALRDMGKLEEVIRCFLDFDREDFISEITAMIPNVNFSGTAFAQGLRLPRMRVPTMADNVLGRLMSGGPARLGMAVKPVSASQSSLSRFSQGSTAEEDAVRALRERIDESYAFHTDREDSPWWQAEFDEERSIAAVRIHNRCDNDLASARFTQFSISVSLDGVNFQNCFLKLDQSLFKNDEPITCLLPGPVLARFVRITSLGPNKFLHLRKVEFFAPVEVS